MKLTISALTKQLRIYAFAVQNWSKKELAEKAGIAEICLRHIHDDNWNPTLDTLRKLEKLVPDEWAFEHHSAIPPLSLSTHTIYVILCLKNKSVYVGETTDYKSRSASHLGYLRRGGHICKKMQSDFNRYGEDSFQFIELFKTEEKEDAERKIIELLSLFTNLYNSCKLKPEGSYQ